MINNVDILYDNFFKDLKISKKKIKFFTYFNNSIKDIETCNFSDNFNIDEDKIIKKFKPKGVLYRKTKNNKNNIF